VPEIEYKKKKRKRVNVNEISAIELLAIYRDVSVIDVRELDEYTSGHIPGAIHIPLSTIPVRQNEIDKSKTHYLICEAGGRSGQAGRFLEDQGFKVVNIAGGTGALRQIGTPLNLGELP
jgi:rhodanese-related sulfurtransferase